MRDKEASNMSGIIPIILTHLAVLFRLTSSDVM